MLSHRLLPPTLRSDLVNLTAKAGRERLPTIPWAHALGLTASQKPLPLEWAGQALTCLLQPKLLQHQLACRDLFWQACFVVQVRNGQATTAQPWFAHSGFLMTGLGVAPGPLGEVLDTDRRRCLFRRSSRASRAEAASQWQPARNRVSASSCACSTELQSVIILRRCSIEFQPNSGLFQMLNLQRPEDSKVLQEGRGGSASTGRKRAEVVDTSDGYAEIAAPIFVISKFPGSAGSRRALS